jgi:hypothetical protein
MKMTQKQSQKNHPFYYVGLACIFVAGALISFATCAHRHESGFRLLNDPITGNASQFYCVDHGDKTCCKRTLGQCELTLCSYDGDEYVIEGNICN